MATTKVVDKDQNDDFIAPVKYDITSFGADYDVEGLVNRLKRGDIFIPPFQRDYVWNQKEASRFIESLLLGLPVPGIFLAREVESKKLLVIDGQQRLKTLQFFFDGYFNPKPEAKTRRVFKLIKVQKQFDGLTYETLSPEDKIILNDSIIHATIVKQESPSGSNTCIYHIFERLNSEGRKLSNQQIRVAIFHGKFIDFIKKLNSYPNWREVYGNPSATLKDQELIIRFFALLFDKDDYKRPMKEFLNKFTLKNVNSEDSFLNHCEILFTAAIDIIWENLGGIAFRPERSFNAAVFDSVMVSIATKIKEGNSINGDKLQEAYKILVKDDDYLSAISQATSDAPNLKFRFDRVNSLFAEV